MKTRRLRIVLVVLLVVAGLAWHASLRVGEGPAAGTTISGPIDPAAVAKPSFRVALLNIHGGKGRDGRRDLARTAQVLADFDLVGLCEVHGREPCGGGNQAESLGRELGRAWLFAPASRRWYCQQFGNGLLTRLGVSSWQRIPLPVENDPSQRNAVLVIVEHRGEPVRVLLTHLTQRDADDRRLQLGAVIRLFLALEEPAVLMGDLNARSDDPQIEALLRRPDVEDVIGRHAPAAPVDRVDWIVVRGLHAAAAGVIDDGASDHPLYWAELEPRDGAGRQ